MIRIPNIGNHSARVGQWRTGKCAPQKPKDQNRNSVSRQGATDLKSGIKDEGEDEDGFSAIGLG